MMRKEDKFEEFLRRSKKEYLGLRVQRTTECPSDEDLRFLCYEENEGPLRQKYMSHVILCRYCGGFIHKEIQQTLEHEQLSSVKEKLFPLPSEIKWQCITAVGLSKDNTCISQQRMIKGVKEYEFEISEAGFYHITIDTGQVLWGREIEQKDILLTDDEQKMALDYGVAASKEKDVPRIVGFRDTCWEGKLIIELVKRDDGAALIVRFLRE